MEVALAAVGEHEHVLAVGAHPHEAERAAREAEVRPPLPLRGVVTDWPMSLKNAASSVTKIRLVSSREQRPSAFISVARGWMCSVSSRSSPEETTETSGEAALRNGVSNSWEPWCGTLKTSASQVDGGVRHQRRLDGVVEVAREQHPVVAERQPQHDRVPVDRVRVAQRAGLEAEMGHRVVTLRAAEELQARLALHRSLDRPQHLDAELLVGEEAERVVVALRQPPDLDRAAARLPGLERALPRLELVVHLAVGHGEQVLLQAGDHRVVAGLHGRAEPLEPRHLHRPLHQPVVEHPAGMREQPLVRVLVRLGLKDLRQPREVVGVAMRDHHRVDLLPLLGRRAAESAGEEAREQLALAAVDRDHPALGRLDQRGVTLLDVDEGDAQHLDLRRRQRDLAVLAVHADAALQESAGRNRLEAAARLDEVDGFDLDPLVVAAGPSARGRPRPARSSACRPRRAGRRSRR